MEEQLIYFLQGFKIPFANNLASVLTESIFVIIPLILLYLLWKKNKNIYPLFISLLLTLLVVTTLKTVILEPRPCSNLPVHFLKCEDPLASFPSAHTALVFSPVFLLLSEAPFFLIYLLYALLVGFTRIYLGVHYPHDVLAGALIGLVISYLCLKTKDLMLKVIYQVGEKLGLRKYLI